MLMMTIKEKTSEDDGISREKLTFLIKQEIAK
jgi:hypothetical protein